MSFPEFEPLPEYEFVPVSGLVERSAEFLAKMRRRRSVRQFSNRPVPREVIVNCVATAGTAPSGANLQPWHFVIVEDASVKQRIRLAAEQEEREFYDGRASKQWLKDLAPLGTGPDKPFLEDAPFLVAVFVEPSSRAADGARRTNYYARLSTGIALGMLITAIHLAGLVCLPYTPGRMGFLNKLLGQPSDHRPVTILVVGYPAEDVQVPVLDRKPIESIVSFV